MAGRGRGDGDHVDMDRGWAWVVAFALASYNFMMGGTLKSYGLLYVEFIHWFPEGPAAVGLIGLLFGISGIIMAPIGGRLSDSISPRKMVLLGGVVLSASFAVTSLAPNLTTAIITYGVLAGGSIGAIDGPILSYLGRYFRRKRNLASGIVWMGSSVGNVALAPLFSFLISEYGIRGTLILLGGVWTHTCIIALLLRPPKLGGSTEIPVSEEDGNKCRMEPESRDSGQQQLQQIEQQSEQQQQQQQQQHEKGQHNGSISMTENVTEFDNSKSEYKANLDDSSKAALFYEGQRQIELSDNERREVIVDEMPIKEEEKEEEKKKEEEKEREMSIVKENNLNQDDVDRQLTTIPVIEKEINASQKDNLLENPTKNSEISLNCGTSDLTSSPDVAMTYGQFLCNASMWRVILTLGCGFYGYYTPIICIPAWGEEMFLSRFQVAVLVSVVGAVEIMSRLLLGYVADRPGVSLSALLTFSYIIMGLAGQLVVLIPSFPSLMVYSILHGLFGGTAHVLMASLLLRTVPVRWIGSATGLAVVQIHMNAAIPSTTGGLMKELTGSYGHIVQVSSGIYFLGALIYNTGPIIAKIRSRSKTQSSSRSGNVR